MDPLEHLLVNAAKHRLVGFYYFRPIPLKSTTYFDIDPLLFLLIGERYFKERK